VRKSIRTLRRLLGWFRQSKRIMTVAWSRDRLFRERAIALGHSIELSTVHAYNSHLQSYLSFSKIHGFPIEPTPDTLRFFVVFMAHHIKPASVAAYLSGICNCLEPHFPDVHSVRNSPIVSRCLAGIKKLCGFLFPSKSTPYLPMTFLLHNDHFSFQLPFHKADHFYQGSKIFVLSKTTSPHNPLPFMSHYLLSRDASFPFHPKLWLTSAGVSPTSSWFTSRLRSTLGPDVGGHSIRSGAATALAVDGIPDNIIQGMGRWSSDAFKVYIHKHPVVLHALIHRVLGLGICSPNVSK
jgi:hypothetical protein